MNATWFEKHTQIKRELNISPLSNQIRYKQKNPANYKQPQKPNNN